MSKPWEQEWYVYENVFNSFSVGLRGVVKRGFRHEPVGQRMTREAATLSAAAPDMARAGLDVVQGVLAGVAPVLGPISADEMVARGQSVTISAAQFAAFVSSLRKAGVPL